MMTNLPIIKIKPCLGDHIKNTIQAAISAARSCPHDAPVAVSFVFNGIEFCIEKDSDPDLIYRDWKRGMNGYHKDVVGPYPLAELSTETLANDAMIYENHRKIAEEENEKYMEKVRAKRVKLQQEISNTIIKLQDGKFDEWALTHIILAHITLGAELASEERPPSNALGIAIYADNWARLMQVRMADGHSLSEIAEQASHDADTDTITGYMYGTAVSFLARFWTHGEELRRWHKLKTQVHNEGELANESDGVLNPALLIIKDETD